MAVAPIRSRPTSSTSRCSASRPREDDVTAARALTQGPAWARTAFQNIEVQTGYPQIKKVTGGTALSLAAIPAAAAVSGANLLQGQTLDTLTSGAGTSSVTVTANRPGISNIQLALTDGGGTHSVSVSGSGTSLDPYIITVNFRGATHSNTDKASDIVS